MLYQAGPLRVGMRGQRMARAGKASLHSSIGAAKHVACACRAMRGNLSPGHVFNDILVHVLLRSVLAFVLFCRSWSSWQLHTQVASRCTMC